MMALSRWRLHTLAALATLAVACGADDGGDETDAGALYDAPTDSPGDVQDATSEREDDGGGDAGDGGPPTPVACGAPLPGLPMDPLVVEAQLGYAAELDGIDVSTVPDPYDYGAQHAVARALINYMLERGEGSQISHVDALALGGMGRAVLAAAAVGSGGSVDIPFLRRGLHHFYQCSRPLPATLAEFKALYGDYTTWDTDLQDCAAPKDGPRRLYTSAELGISITETLVGASVRETEIIFQRLRGDGNFDFAVYTSAGALSDRSTFATFGGTDLTSASPFTCLSCHVELSTGKYDVLRPTGTGAGCQ